MGYTPMIEQYLEIKNQHQDAILFFRLGDFYEMFFDDAVLAARELEITLTGRDGGENRRIPMCGVPYHAAQTYITRLIQKSYKVAICEQMEEPGAGRGIVRRQVTRIVTPGTLIEEQTLEEKKHNFLAAVRAMETSYGLAFADVTTGLFMATQFDGDSSENMLLDELARLQPAEILLADAAENNKTASRIKKRCSAVISFVSPGTFSREKAIRILSRQLGPAWQQSALNTFPRAVDAAGGLMVYLKDTQKCDLLQINQVQLYSPGQYMILDAITRRNLELTASMRDGSRWGTLLWVLDYTVTAMGGRLIRSWIERPLLDLKTIRNRLDALEETVNNIFFRHELKQLLSSIYDLERLTARVAYGSANARDMLALKDSLSVLPSLKQLLLNNQAKLWLEIAGAIDCQEDLRELLENSISEDPPFSVREGGIIKPGYHPEADRLQAASRSGKDWLVNLETRERERTGIKSLKIGFNKVFGYYIEVTRTNLNLVAEDYIRKQTLANAERFITPELKELEEKILGAEDRLVQLEYQLFVEIRDQVAAVIPALQKTAHAAATADCLLSLAEAAIKANYTRPQVSEKDRILIREGRHPVLERVLSTGEFVPNDILLNEENRLIILTGPNMAGKSTYMRQAALLVLMAQMGSFVPARQAEVGLVDRILTRVGASDDLAIGQSTFMTEMNECRTIINSATVRSLIIMDEVGRGTSTYDGISIAWALVEYIATQVKAKTLFSTHYHELTDLEKLAGVRNFTITVQEQGEDIVFLRQVLPGKADRSYGIQVARLAGLPRVILSRAREIMNSLEYRQAAAKQPAPTKGNPGSDMDGKVHVEPAGRQVVKELTALNVCKLTPLEALNLVARWQENILGKGSNHRQDFLAKSEMEVT
ncbi:MAG TPA: DNA mismatch repair protein MutS [Desulfotomaculum sp.]|nr:DNA mismatch repair protein MutS [Desulfotomaculum sp.]